MSERGTVKWFDDRSSGLMTVRGMGLSLEQMERMCLYIFPILLKKDLRV